MGTSLRSKLNTISTPGDGNSYFQLHSRSKRYVTYVTPDALYTLCLFVAILKFIDKTYATRALWLRAVQRRCGGALGTGAERQRVHSLLHEIKAADRYTV